TADVLESTPKFETCAEKEQASKVYTFKEDERAFKITRDSDATRVLSGEQLARLSKMTYSNNDESLMSFARQLRGMGVDDTLRERGAKGGEFVRIEDFTFEFVE